MFELGIISGSRKDLKNWTTTCVKKKSKRKKHYVSSGEYEKYLRSKKFNKT